MAEELTTFTISQHAKERYAERIMNKDDKTSVVQYVNDNDLKITENINKMITYGKLIYSGKTMSTDKTNNSISDVYVKDLWIIIVDKVKKNVITLYKIDLKAGEDLDKMYMERMLGSIEKETEEWNALKINNGAIIDNTRLKIAENEEAITEYKKRIKSLEEQNETDKAYIVTLNQEIEMAESNIRDIVADLIGRKVF